MLIKIELCGIIDKNKVHFELKNIVIKLGGNMSKKINGVNLDDLKTSVIELIYQVKSQNKLDRIQTELHSINDILNKYDKKWENLIDNISLAITKNSKRYYTSIIDDIFDKIDQYTDDEKKKIEKILQSIIQIANEGLWDEIKKVISIGK